MVSRPRDDGRRRYICAKGPNFVGCGGTFIVADELERFVVEAILYRLDSPELAAAMNGDGGDAASEKWQTAADQAAAQLKSLPSPTAIRRWLPPGVVGRARAHRAPAHDGQAPSITRSRRLRDRRPLGRGIRVARALAQPSAEPTAVGGQRCLGNVSVGPARRGLISSTHSTQAGLEGLSTAERLLRGRRPRSCARVGDSNRRLATGARTRWSRTFTGRAWAAQERSTQARTSPRRRITRRSSRPVGHPSPLDRASARCETESAPSTPEALVIACSTVRPRTSTFRGWNPATSYRISRPAS